MPAQLDPRVAPAPPPAIAREQLTLALHAASTALTCLSPRRPAVIGAPKRRTRAGRE
ncbi:hypothetical protein [Muricoccus aerilatus]|uniref:hypothetical protein n=1 Tax=Muricoccus aerilatus TaxID=452982 RepID=UPI0012EC5B6B|nr:hypothetical protein [Roseomonas aerilata]